MRLLDLTLPYVEDNLALDEALLLEAEGHGGECLRLWEWSKPAVVLGAAGILVRDVNEAACREGGVPIVRRASGGGTVLLDSGCLLYSLVLNYQRAPELTEILPSYRHILSRIRDALVPFDEGVEVAGTSDLASNGRKFSGNAQQRKRRHLLHHGSLLYGFAVDQVGRYVHMPERQPAYREHRDHGAFLMNLPATSADLKRRLQECWQAEPTTSTWPKELVERLAADKYRRGEWVRRR